VAYNTLLLRRRRELHAAVAQAMAELYPSDEHVETIAFHYSRTDDHQSAAAWLERAGHRAASLYANDTALGHYREAARRLDLIGADDLTRARLAEKMTAVAAT
jgi:hypothetical protein